MIFFENHICSMFNVCMIIIFQKLYRKLNRAEIFKTIFKTNLDILRLTSDIQ